MTIKEFLDHLPRLARPRYDWIVLGDGSICVRDRVNADPLNMVAMQINPTFSDEMWQRDEFGDRCRQILQMSEEDFTDLSNEIFGDTYTNEEVFRSAIKRALNME